jgi:aryl-alcohol dehydrogenase-like predicted oxidoreductase
MTAVEGNLRRLGTDWVDLHQVHQTAPRTPTEENLWVLDGLVTAGKVRYIGCSNYPSGQVVEAQRTGSVIGSSAFASYQDEESLLVRATESELIPTAVHDGLWLLPYFPRQAPLLTGKYRRDVLVQKDARLSKTQYLADRYLTDRNWELTEIPDDFATSRDHTLVELAVSWHLACPPAANVIAGAARPEQIQQKVHAGDWSLTAEELAQVDPPMSGKCRARVSCR